jgi:hypothetical protein
MECRVDGGVSRWGRDTAAKLGEGSSMGGSRETERLVDALVLRVGSGLDAGWLDTVFLANRPDESLGGCFGMREVTNGDRKVGKVGV